MAARDPNSAPDAPLFTAMLRPHRSLSSAGLNWVMGFVCLVGLAVSIPFFLLGAWPVIGFMGLDIGLIYLAFRANNAAARAYEQVFVSRVLLLVRVASPRGDIREKRFNPLWTKLEREEHPEFGTERLAFRQGRDEMEIARFLGRDERATLAANLQRALAEARR